MSPNALLTCSSQKTMAAAEAWTCPVCREARRDVAYATPCNHQFCLGCIQRWAMLKTSCPLCRTAMRTIKVSVWGDEHHVECVVSPPAVPLPAQFHHGSTTRPSGTAAHAPSSGPLPPQQRAAGPQRSVRVGGLLPQEWAAAFRERRHILDPVLPGLHQKLSAIHGIPWWQVRSTESLFLCCLCQLGLDTDAMARCIEPSVGPIATPIINWLTDTIVSLCGREVRRMWGLEDESTAGGQEDSPTASSPQTTLAPSSSEGPSAEEIPGTSSRALHGGAAQLPAAPSPREQQQPRDEQGQEAAGPSAQRCSCSAPGRGRKRSAGGPRRPTKRRASSTQRAPQPCKRPPPRRL